MKLNQKENQLVTELKNQELLCIQKYDFYAKQAKDPELKKIANRKPLSKDFEPQKSHKGSKEEVEFDKFLCTDLITTEKYVATDYNNDLFYFVSPEVRNVLNAIMTDEQNHAEMIWKYKQANKMIA